MNIWLTISYHFFGERVSHAVKKIGAAARFQNGLTPRRMHWFWIFGLHDCACLMLFQVFLVFKHVAQVSHSARNQDWSRIKLIHSGGHPFHLASLASLVSWPCTSPQDIPSYAPCPSSRRVAMCWVKGLRLDHVVALICAFALKVLGGCWRDGTGNH